MAALLFFSATLSFFGSVLVDASFKLVVNEKTAFWSYDKPHIVRWLSKHVKKLKWILIRDIGICSWAHRNCNYVSIKPVTNDRLESLSMNPPRHGIGKSCTCWLICIACPSKIWRFGNNLTTSLSSSKLKTDIQYDLALLHYIYLLYISPVGSFSINASRNGLLVKMSSLSCDSFPPALSKLSWLTFAILFCWNEMCCTLGMNLANIENGLSLLSWLRANDIVITCDNWSLAQCGIAPLSNHA